MLATLVTGRRGIQQGGRYALCDSVPSHSVIWAVTNCGCGVAAIADFDHVAKLSDQQSRVLFDRLR
jgi:hypothetical protein